MTDEQIRVLLHTDRDAWCRAVDPHYRETCERREHPAPAPKAAPAPALAPADRYITGGVLQKTLELIGRAVTAKIDKRCADLERRLKEVESRPLIRYRGVFTEGETYHPGELATHSGSMFYCWAPTKCTPGTSDAWQLCVKRGTNGRDAR